MIARRTIIGRGRFDPVESCAKRMESCAKRMESCAKRMEGCAKRMGTPRRFGAKRLETL